MAEFQMSKQETERQTHLDWCKKRALEFVDQGDLKNAFMSFCSDIRKHPDTEDLDIVIKNLGMPLFFGGCLDTPDRMREHINGYN